MVNHLIPNDLEEALIALNTTKYKIMAGGTDLMVQHRSTSETVPKFENPLLFVFNLPELNYIKATKETLYIGSMTSLETIKNHENTPILLKKVIGLMAGPGIRRMSTLSGNIGNASPAGDSLVALYALNATCKITSKDDERTVPIAAIIKGPRQTILKDNELITEIQVPIESFSINRFHKVGGRKADAISKVAFAGVATIDDDKVTDMRIVLNAVAPTVIRDVAFEKTLDNLNLIELKSAKEKILRHYETLIQPIDDQRSNKSYRKTSALNLIATFIDIITS